VDSTEVAGDLSALARRLAQQRNATVVLTGKVDVVADRSRVSLVSNGHPMMTKVVGTGCMAASVIGAFVAVESDYRRASVAALTCYEIAAELAAQKASGPGSFKQLFFDALYQLDRPTVDRLQRIEETA
jgi:hydroxyethylthiazole kinase